MIDENVARLRTHRNNISRYRRLLKTQLTDCERQFIERRLSEEKSALQKVAATTFPLAFPYASERRSHDNHSRSRIVIFGGRTAMSPRFPTFEIVLKKGRRTTWRWRVCTSEGDVVMRGSETTRSAARYQAERAFFLLLLSAPHHSAISRRPTSPGVPPPTVAFRGGGANGRSVSQ